MPTEQQADEPNLVNQPMLAALDLGSNSFHLVIARIVEGDLQILARYKERVRLAAGLNSELELSAEAMQRGLENLQRCNERLQDIPKANVRVVATHTLRACKNRNTFLKQAKKVLAHPIEIISGHEEARLIFQAVAHTEHLPGRTLVIDIGGGSTELVIGSGFEVEQLTSRSMGCVSYTQQFFTKGVTEKAFKQAVLAAHQALEPIAQIFRRQGWDQVLATSGTAAALSSIASQFSGQPTITLQALQQAKAELVAVGDPTQCQLQGINETRLPVLAGGIAIMQAVMESLSIGRLRYSEAALREGVLYEMDDTMRHHDIRLRTRRSLQARYRVDREQATRVKQSAAELWQQVYREWKLPESSLELLLHAAALHEVGLNINAYSVHKHGSYILQHVDMPGIHADEQQLIALLVRFYRKKLLLEEIAEPGRYSAKQTVRLIRILRLAVLLNISRTTTPLATPGVKVDGQAMQLSFATDYLQQQQLLNADLLKEAALLEQHEMLLSFS